MISDTLLALQEKLFDFRYGLETVGNIDVKELPIDSFNLSHAKIYQPTRIQTFQKIVRALPSEVLEGRFMDFGCGKGRVLAMAFQAGFRGVVGVDFSSDLCRIARKNLKKLPARNGEILCDDAVNVEIPVDVTLFYFFNPFGEPVMREVLEKIQRSLEEYPRLAYVVYVVPVHHRLLSRSPFQLVRKIEGRGLQLTHIYQIEQAQSFANYLTQAMR